MQDDRAGPPKELTAGRSVAIYAVVAGLVCFALLGQADLTRMEPIIALGGRHMREAGQWFVPRLYGQVYAFKPALAYWLAAAAEWAAGRSEFALRLPTAMCGLLLGLLIQQVLARLVSPRCGLSGGLLAVTSFLFVEQARMAGFDMPLALGVGAAMLAACRNLATGRSDWRWWMLGYGGLLIGFLAKGLPSVLLYGPGLVLAAAFLGRLRLLFRWQHLSGAGFFVLGASAYVYLAYQEAGDSVWAQQVDEIRSRASAWTIHSVAATLLKPLVMFAVFLPGSLLALFHLAKRSKVALTHTSGIASSAWAFLAAGALMFMLTPATNSRYYLPLATPVALLAAIASEGLRAPSCTRSPQEGSRRPVVRRRDPVVWAVLAGLMFWSAYVFGIELARGAKRSLREVAAAIAPHVPAGETVYVDVGDSFSSLFYYLDRRVETRPIDSPPPAEPIFVLLAGEQAETLAGKPGIVVQPLAEQQGSTGKRFVIALAARGEEPDPAAASTRAKRLKDAVETGG